VCTIKASKVAWSWLPGASPTSLDYGLQEHRETCTNKASKIALLWPQSVSPSLHHHGLLLHLLTCWIAASQYLFKECWGAYGNTGVTEVDSGTESTYLANPGVYRQHFISILSYHTLKVHSISCNVWSDSRCPRFGSPQLPGTSTQGSIISSHPIPTLLELLKCWPLEALLCSIYLRWPQVQYIWECKYHWMLSGHTRVNSHLWSYKTLPSPALWATCALELQYISTPGRRGSYLAETGVCNTLPSCYALCSNKQTHKKTWYSSCDFHSSHHKILSEWAGKEYYLSLRMAIHRETRKSASSKEKWNNLKSNHKSPSITKAPSQVCIFRTYPSIKPRLVWLPHSRSCACRSSWLFVAYGDLDNCDRKHWYA
jgi:hypothetical protein